MPTSRIVAGPTYDFRATRRRLGALIAGWTGLAALGLIGCDRSDSQRPWQGTTFPEFALPAPAGTLHHRREYAGRPLLVNFWATWCPPCRQEMADLDALHHTLGYRGLQVLAISVDADQNLVREYLRREGFGFEVLIDDNRQWSASALGVQAIPVTYLVDRDGLIRNVWIGPRAWADPALQTEIASMVGLT